MKNQEDRVFDLCKGADYFTCPATATSIQVTSTEKESIEQISDAMIFEEYSSQPDIPPPNPDVVISTASSEAEYSKSEVRKKVYRVTKKVA